MFLRRLFARRGTPASITRDIAPTFVLAETITILNEGLKSIRNDPELAVFLPFQLHAPPHFDHDNTISALIA
ncbi:unnamed protein product [Angiostrongylus costaricensis]|uniref:Uncharacterized protein n=1 Tax=Angiostrongylus costaricensis TaxID=334426 RepID=A0A0R3Q250_ANGCS|nr:unnamed protein product [Angiostrongylus costaricensis]